LARLLFIVMTVPYKKNRLNEIIFETNTPLGKAFDVALLIIILASIQIVIFESISVFNVRYAKLFYSLEWIFTIIFIIEYAARLYCVKNRWKYFFSFYGLVDLLACLPTIISLLMPGTQSLIIIRALRLLRIFRVFKLTHFFDEGMVILNTLKAARTKILVFLYTVILIVMIAGTTMYLIEGPEAGFTSIPTGMYWAVVTLTTVGYGDLIPTTNLGRVLASLLMISGYAIIAVPTGIVTSEFTKSNFMNSKKRKCLSCLHEDHAHPANFCSNCGTAL
jgi:voltage-gated potassium channel